jgi:hypothetical protein
MKLFFGQSFVQSFWPTETNGILGISIQVIGVSLGNDSVQINYCNPQIMQCTICHSNPTNGNANNVLHGKNKGFMSYNKTTRHIL